MNPCYSTHANENEISITEVPTHTSMPMDCNPRTLIIIRLVYYSNMYIYNSQRKLWMKQNKHFVLDCIFKIRSNFIQYVKQRALANKQKTLCMILIEEK